MIQQQQQKLTNKSNQLFLLLFSFLLTKWLAQANQRSLHNTPQLSSEMKQKVTVDECTIERNATVIEDEQSGPFFGQLVCAHNLPAMINFQPKKNVL